MATKWPQKRRLIGTRVQRVDGSFKATGRARYSYDINRPGQLHAVMLRSPHAHAKIKSLDTSDAEKMPGFKAIHVVANAGKELFYAGDEVLAIACDTEEHAQDAVRAVKIEYEVLPHLVREEDALKKDLGTVPGGGQRKNVNVVSDDSSGKGAKGFDDADVVSEGEYGVAVIAHQCLEPHGLVAEWGEDDSLTVWASTQAVTGTAQQLAIMMRIPATKVKCITHYIGGGFGSKFGPDIQGRVAAELARKAKAPVKLMLDRASEITAGGNRPSIAGKVKIGAKKDGTIVAYEADVYSIPGHIGAATVKLPYVYTFPNTRVKQTAVRLNRGNQRAMRAPNHPQSCFMTDCALDDLAAKLGMDPMLVRLKNLPPNDQEKAQTNPIHIDAIRHTLYTRQIEIAAAKSDWKKKWHPPGAGTGVVKHGIGMALHTWGGQASGQVNECKVVISKDGSVLAESSTQDLGTAQRTVTAIVVAELLGLKPEDITLKIGESQYGRSTGSGGSTTCPSQAPATLQAVAAARDDLFEKIAKKLGSKKEDLSLENGKVVDKGRDKSWSWKEACARLGMDDARGTGTWTFAESEQPENRGISSSGVGGVQVAEVSVDTETGIVRCTRVVAVQDCGLIINKLGCESQVAGGVIMGVNYALFEENLFDATTGRQVNDDMEFYKLGGIKDMPDVVVHMMDMPERGVIGIGEPPTISTAAAIGNAVFNALGVRVPYTPFTPDHVLAALAKKGGKQS
ncbi:MAG: xanthine dehydrogenase family protein molybdopterin-binding subunit [Planctomycetes bacterium]|nr:xanthine dehydrogenase family protein molybdopterin-binding subunit [Planctomycetota bacterium]